MAVCREPQAADPNPRILCSRVWPTIKSEVWRCWHFWKAYQIIFQRLTCCISNIKTGTEGGDENSVPLVEILAVLTSCISCWRLPLLTKHTSVTHQVNIRSEKQGKFVSCYIILCITVVKSAFLRFVVCRLLGNKWWESLLALLTDRLDSHSGMTGRTPSHCAHFAFGSLSAVSMNSLKIIFFFFFLE